MRPAELLWTPSPARVAQAGVTKLRAWLQQERGLQLDGYEALWRWSVTDLEGFWSAVWDFCGVLGHRPEGPVLGKRAMPGAEWFPGATLNYARQSLAPGRRPGWADAPAILARSETRPPVRVSWSELEGRVSAVAATLRRLGVARGDRVVAYLPNIPEAVVALLATASLGAVWSASSPEMGPVSVLDRFRQIAPKVLFAVDGYRYGGKDHDRREVVRDLVRKLPSLEAVVFVPYLAPGAALPALDEGGRRMAVVPFAEASARPAPLSFEAVPFDHPLWIVYSSGTTGMPKPIVHGHGGTVLENLKACALHFDVGAGDRFFWQTSTSWIMWNLLVSTLAAGCTLLTFDGNPGHPDLRTLFRFAAEERATFFGVSPAFLGLCAKAGVRPREELDLSALRTVGSTGSPLTEESYRWVYAQVHPDVLLASISGGTDPGAAFLTACPALPVYAGEMQCRSLGAAVEAFDEAGKPVLDQVGELAVLAPMPSMPLYFWGDEGGKRYYESYFDTWPGVWRHGDWLQLVPRPESVTSLIYGRSDSTINRHGVRMGTSELYRVVDELPEVADSLAVDLEYLGRESFLALFVVLRDPSAAAGAPLRGPSLDGEAAGRASRTPGADTGVPPALRQRLIDELRAKLSARHAPNAVFAVPEVPRTLSGKKLEVPVKKILLGQPLEKSVNRDSMANPGSIDWFVAFARGRAAAAPAQRL
ncbi:MAG: acetoacetate--CoA ligase [Myxococcales bacterium]